jgi:hypothetical protein
VLLLRSCCSLFVGRALQEVIEDEAVDEFSAFFRGEKTPKILFTTSQKPTKVESSLRARPRTGGIAVVMF